MMEIMTEPTVSQALVNLVLHILFEPYQLLAFSWLLIL